MERKHNREIIPNARNLRKNMTKEEKHLWYDFLRNYKMKIYRQKILGKYIADFYCAKAKLVIEIDGSQHFNDEGERKDYERTKFLEKYDLMIVRIPNNEINKKVKDYSEEEFYAIYLAMVSDYKNMFNDPTMYLRMAKDWLEDNEVAMKSSEKVCAYLYAIVLGEED